MRHGTRLLISTSVLVIMIGAIFFVRKPEPPSYAQNLEGFKMYQLNVFCGGTSLVSKIFTHSVTSGGTEGRPLMGTLVHCVGNCGVTTGPVTLEAALAGLPAQVAAALQAEVDEYQGNAAAGKRLTCVGAPKNPPKCRIPPEGADGEESFYTIPPGTKYDPLPKGLRLSQLLPDVAACDGCKWDLVKGALKCVAKSSGTGLFWYEATWKCPKTGMEVWRTSKQRLLRQKCS